LRIFKNILVGIALVAGLSAYSREVMFTDGTVEWRATASRFLEKHADGNGTDSLAAHLTDCGFLDAAVTDRGDSSGAISVTFGPRYEIGVVRVETGDSVEVRRIDKVLERGLLYGIIDSILDDHRNRGYYFAEVVIDSVIRKGNTLDIEMKIHPGAAAVVTDIQFVGLHKTDPRHLEKYLYINRGDTIKPSGVDRAVKNLGRLDYLEMAAQPEIVPEPGFWGSRLVFSIREKKQFYFNGAVGYVPNNGGTLVGYMNFIARNFFGRGRKAEFLFDRRDTNNSTFMVSFRQPVFISGPGLFNTRLKTRDYRDYFYEFGLDADYYQPLSQSFDMTAALGWKNVEPADSAAFSYEVWRASLGINWGRIVAERSIGFQSELDWTISYSRRIYRANNGNGIPSRKVFNDTRSEIRLGTQMKIFTGFSGHVLLDFKDIESSEGFLPLSELYLIGGLGSLRGYRPDQFAADRLVSLAHEWRFFFSERDYFYPFADGVYFERNEADLTGEKHRRSWIKWGYGLGVSLSSNAGRLELSLAWGEEAAIDQPRLAVQLSGQF